MAETAAHPVSGKLVIRNIGLLLSGDIDHPILDADTIVCDKGLIVAVGKEKDCDTSQPDTLIDARRTCVAPGLIDSHVHPVFGDWTPRQNQLGWIESTMNGGVTTMISAMSRHAAAAFSAFRSGSWAIIPGTSSMTFSASGREVVASQKLIN